MQPALSNGTANSAATPCGNARNTTSACFASSSAFGPVKRNVLDCEWLANLGNTCASVCPEFWREVAATNSTWGWFSSNRTSSSPEIGLGERHTYTNVPTQSAEKNMASQLNQWPNKSPEPTRIIAVSNSQGLLVCIVAGSGWLSFFR